MNNVWIYLKVGTQKQTGLLKEMDFLFFNQQKTK